MDKGDLFRKIPAVDRVLATPVVKQLLTDQPRNLALKAIHQVLEEARKGIQKGDLQESGLSLEVVSHQVAEVLKTLSRPSLRPVINATGVVVHTNLGRSILAERVLRRFKEIAGGYSNLEYDLVQGQRGSRYSHVEGILRELTSAEAAMVVNNNAAAVLIALDTLAKGREVIVSRGQLVEIGGSFRIPEVMRKGGVTMVEVGTTNRTHLRDYEGAIGPETALLLRVHTSNYHIVGFTSEVPLPELVALGRSRGVPVMEDLGSGSFLDLSRFGLPKEPTAQEALAQGVDLITFSGDKLLGGPQAGVILGNKDLVEAIRKNPMNRAIRIDKLTLLALEETLRLYRDENVAIKEIPTLRMICEPYSSLKKRARRLLGLVKSANSENFSVEVTDGSSKVGGGALPLAELPTRLLCLVPKRLSPHYMESWFRAYDPPVITRVDKERVLFDVRTIQDRELISVAEAIKELSLLT